jgi:uncharacterized protein
VKLRLSPDVTLPIDAVTQTFAILGKRGSGKTNTAGVLTEQLIGAALPVCYVDPIGVTWGLRYSRDAKSPGLPVVILGGDHADVPLDESGGAVVADFLLEHRPPSILDLGLFSKGAQRRFMVDFAERLYHKNREPLHLLLDECDTFVPQRIDHGGERLVGAINDLVRKGRARGIGVTLISQRPALINKDVLTQVETLIAHRMTGPHDRDAIARWIEMNADEDGAGVLASLQVLGDGDAWIWSPSYLHTLRRTHINLRETFDSSATPKAGARPIAPGFAATVDLAALRERLATTIAKAKADDPRELRRRISELEKEAKNAAAAAAPPRLAAAVEDVRALVESMATLDGIDERIAAILAEHRARVGDAAARVERLLGELDASPPKRPAPAPTLARANGPAPATPKRAPTPIGGGHTLALKGTHRRMLLPLAQHGACSKERLAVLVGYAPTGGRVPQRLERAPNGRLPRRRRKAFDHARGPPRARPLRRAPRGQRRPLRAMARASADRSRRPRDPARSAGQGAPDERGRGRVADDVQGRRPLRGDGRRISQCGFPPPHLRHRPRQERARTGRAAPVSSARLTKSVCKRCQQPIAVTQSGHLRAHACPHGAACVVPYTARRAGEKPEACAACLEGRNLLLPFGDFDE